MYLAHSTNCTPTPVNSPILFNFLPSPHHAPKPKTIMQETIDRICWERGVSKHLVMGKSRKRILCVTRQMIAYIMLNDLRLAGMTLENLATALNMRDHSAIIYSTKTMQALIDTDRRIREQVTALQRIIYNY